ncbi:hypothetical protein [Nocardia puris]|uniref:hypothetical protein n=1 Tax=Nocardia puris TaxID=208602 RepID=UPI000AA18F7F|nr:hypothetical protein [Nocardia puris]
MATVGVSTDISVVRVVLLPNPRSDGPSGGPSGGPPEQIDREVDRAGPAAAVTAVLGDLADRTLSLIENIAVTYRTPGERRELVTHLGAGRWRTTSLVSVRAALLAFVREHRELDRFGTLLGLEVSERELTYLVTGPSRERVLAAGAWKRGDDAAAEAFDHVHPALITHGLRIDGIALFGTKRLRPALREQVARAFDAETVTLDGPPDPAALGAAVIAAGQLPEDEPATVLLDDDTRRAAGLLPVGIALATLLGLAGPTVAHLTDDAVWTRPVTVSSLPSPDRPTPRRSPPTRTPHRPPPCRSASRPPTTPPRPRRRRSPRGPWSPRPPGPPPFRSPHRPPRPPPMHPSCPRLPHPSRPTPPRPPNRRCPPPPPSARRAPTGCSPASRRHRRRTPTRPWCRPGGTTTGA